MGVSKNSGTPQIIHFNRVFHYFHHPFWGLSLYFWKHPDGLVKNHHLDDGTARSDPGSVISLHTAELFNFKMVLGFHFGGRSHLENNPIGSMYGIIIYLHLVDVYGECR